MKFMIELFPVGYLLKLLESFATCCNVRTMILQFGEISQSCAIPGRVNAANGSEIGIQCSGRIVEQAVEDGIFLLANDKRTAEKEWITISHQSDGAATFEHRRTIGLVRIVVLISTWIVFSEHCSFVRETETDTTKRSVRNEVSNVEPCASLFCQRRSGVRNRMNTFDLVVFIC